MNYKVGFTPTAEKEIRSLPKTIQPTALRQIKTLELNVIPDGKRIKKLKGVKGTFYGLRVGNYRVVFEVEEYSIIIHRIIDRKELDRVVSKLKS